MTWARTRTRASNNVIHVKQESMGIGANAAARIDREHSLNVAAIDKAVAELKFEIAVREKRKKELEFLEKGGDPLEFEYADGSSVSVTDLILSESEAKERKLFLLQNKSFSNGIVAEIRKGLDSIKAHASRDSGAEHSRLGRNGDSSELSKQVLRRGTLPSIVRIKEEKSSPSPNPQPELRPENGETAGASEPIAAPAKPAEDAEAETQAAASSPGKDETPAPGIEPEADAAKGDSETRLSLKDSEPPSVAEDVVNEERSSSKLDSAENQESVAEKIVSTRNEEELLESAKVIQAAREWATRKAIAEPARRSHWDFVLEEMAWMANDFMQERLWKSSAAAILCRSAAQASFWAKAEKKLAEARNRVEEAPAPGEKDSNASPLENYAYSFLNSEAPGFSVPCTPDAEERVLAKKLHFIVPAGASEAFRLSVERSWGSRRARQDENESEPDDDSFFQDKSVALKREFEQSSKKKRRAEADPDVLEDEFSEFFDVPVKRQRTSGVVGRPRSDKKSKKGGKPNRIKLMSRGTDSENEWVPEPGFVEKMVSQEKQIKRKKDQVLTNKTKDELPSSKKTKLIKLGDSALKKIRKGDFLHVSINHPGNGVPWTSLEDQAILVLQQDFGPNWEFLSNILNAGCHLKGHYRSPKDCKERHLLLAESIGSSADAQSYSGMLKGTSMMMLQKMQGPMEEDMVKYHLEQIVEVKKRQTELLKDFPHEILQPVHESFYEVHRNHSRYLSPLDFADQPVIQKADQVAVVNPTAVAGNGELRPPRPIPEEKPAEPHPPPKSIKKLVQKAAAAALEEKEKLAASVVKQEQPAVHRAQQQQFQALSQKQQRGWEQKDHPLQRLAAAPPGIPDQSRLGAAAAQQVSGVNTSVCRPNFQPKKQPAAAPPPLPPCSTSQQHHEPPSFPDHHHQHPQLQPSFRLPQQGGGMDPRMMQQQQQQSFHYNHRCYSTPGPRFSPGAGQWRPGAQGSPGMYNQMNVMGSPVDASAFQQQQQQQQHQHQQQQQQQARFQSPGMAPRSLKQQQQQMQRAAAQHYLAPAAPGGGGVRYPYPGSHQPGFHHSHSVYNNGKAWQQQTQGNGGVGAAGERSCLEAPANGLDSGPPSSCK